MLNASFIGIVLAVALLLGGGFMTYLWLVKQRQLVVAGGIATLAGMRWREFSRFVIEALQAQGFDTHADEHNPDQTDLRLARGGQTWLLSCRQGPNTRITGTHVGELNNAIRLNGAAGGMLVTLGTVEPSARKLAGTVEMIDGATLWPLIDPLLPPSVHNGLLQKARNELSRTAALGWIGALVAGIGVALLIAPKGTDVPPATVNETNVANPAATKGTATTVATPASGPAAPTITIAPLPEDQQRKHVIDAVGSLPGVDSVAWSTRSTLQIQLTGPADQPQVDAVCAVVKRYEAIRTSRLHLQPSTDSGGSVRFLQCATF